MTTSATLSFVQGSKGLSSKRPRKVLENEVLGISIFIISELMFFTALISAYLVIKAATGNTWVPPEHVRLPVFMTALNTGLLLVSGLLTWLSGRVFAGVDGKESHLRATKLLLASTLLGLMFVTVQGYEWFKLVSVGMTLTSGIFASTFYLLIGAHAFHVMGAVLAMVLVSYKLMNGQISAAGFQAMRLFWYFVVGIWPVLYGLVYF